MIERPHKTQNQLLSLGAFTPLEIKDRAIFYTYVIRSKKDGKLYTGSTNNLRKRLKEHNDNKVFSTKGRSPFELIYYEACINEQDTREREKYLKSGMGKRYLKNRLKRFLSLTGFTLIEILTVVIIIGIVLAASLPLSIRSFRNLQLVDTARSMMSMMRYVQNKAILEGRTYRIDFDLAGSYYTVNVQTNGNFENFEKVKTSLLSKKNLGPNLKIEYLAIKKEDFLDEDKSSLYFYPDGSMDEAQLVLSNTQDEKIIIETSLSGKINVIE